MRRDGRPSLFIFGRPGILGIVIGRVIVLVIGCAMGLEFRFPGRLLILAKPRTIRRTITIILSQGQPR